MRHTISNIRKALASIIIMIVGEVPAVRFAPEFAMARVRRRGPRWGR